jgi:hypothetical protein
MKLEFSRQILGEKTNDKFNENAPSVIGVVPWGSTDGQTDMKKLTDACRNFAKSPLRVRNLKKLDDVNVHQFLVLRNKQIE